MPLWLLLDRSYVGWIVTSWKDKAYAEPDKGYAMEPFKVGRAILPNTIVDLKYTSTAKEPERIPRILQ